MHVIVGRYVHNSVSLQCLQCDIELSEAAVTNEIIHRPDFIVFRMREA